MSAVKKKKIVNAATPKNNQDRKWDLQGAGIDGVEDEERETPQEAGEHEPGEEFGERKTIRKHGPHQLMNKRGLNTR